MSRDRDLRDEPAANRSGDTDACGHKHVRLEILVTEQMADDIAAVATIERIAKGEYMRRCIERDLYGRLELMLRTVRKRDE